MISILFLTADPTDASRLRLGEELREIQEKLQLSKWRDYLTLHHRASVRPADISQALLDIDPRIVHFSGHGTTDGALCFENNQGEMHPIQPTALEALFEQFKNRILCVVLNACYSVNQAEAIAQHVPYVIGMNQAISDRAAIAFSVGFYQALGAGRWPDEAYKLGCVQLMLQGIPESSTPALISRESATYKQHFSICNKYTSSHRIGFPIDKHFWESGFEYKESSEALITENVEMDDDKLVIRFSIYNRGTDKNKIYDFQTVEYDRKHLVLYSGGGRDVLDISADKPFIEQDRTFEINPKDSISFRLNYKYHLEGGGIQIVVGVIAYFHTMSGELGVVKSDKLYLMEPPHKKVFAFDEQTVDSILDTQTTDSFLYGYTESFAKREHERLVKILAEHRAFQFRA